tara:strand:+ start:343 stop:645 length:303 start_codon:yes stop_codon:yes gene_type:complete
VDPEDDSLVMDVWIKDTSFLDIQKAAQEMFNVGADGNVSLNLEGYWRFAFNTWITKTDPLLTKDELLNLKGFAGESISKLLPSPDELAKAMQGGFMSDSK